MVTRRFGTHSNDLRDEYADITNLYFMRVVCRTSAHDPSPRIHRFESAFRCAVGPLRDQGYKEHEILDLMGMHLEDLEKNPPKHEGPLFDNLDLLSKRLGLGTVEQEILALRVLARTHGPLEDTLQGLGPLPATSLTRVLSNALDIDRRQIDRALEPENPLISSGLMGVSTMLNPFLDKLYLASGLSNALLKPHDTLEELISFAVSKSAPPTLGIEDYPHLREDVLLISRFLQSAMKSHLAGVNILFYGPPGVGKTQLARTIAASLSFALYEVTTSETNGAALNSADRYARLRFNQSLFAVESQTIILFDEVEEALRNLPAFHPLEGVMQNHKGWINRLLEQNPVPTFWIANSLSHIDAALLRRFDYILEVRNAPQSVRRRILTSSLEGLPLPPGWLERQAQEEKLTPAFTARAAKVLRLADITEPADVAKHFERIIRNQIEARQDSLSPRYPLTSNYSLEFVNASTDLKHVCGTLTTRRKGRLLLYGPPGTGKTAFSHHLAQIIERPLMIRRASDILSPWLGETEKNMARMFRDAASEDAVLLLDEADSFLQDRRDAVRSWEITQVNELLTQMECFEGLFLCATNFRENLDTAAMRRFGLKVKFDYLNAEQAWKMFLKTLTELGVGELPTGNQSLFKREIASLSNLAPGDFTAARQSLELLSKGDLGYGLFRALQEESRLKPDGGRLAIGFA